MLARGEVCGLLTLSAEASSDENSLATLQPIATALADAMSLALANISLRERLRNQALRDPLTGLYNRRFLEEMLERFTLEAERRHSPLAAVMVDLDHFKRLNDQFGHATGDAVLRQVANTVLAGLRGSDVACRYGGEELALLMPDCSQTEAEAKAEQLRLAIEDFARDGRLPKVTASFGVAGLPEATTRTDELLRLADGALYQAKQQGRNRVAAAPCRPLTQALVAAA
jgi:diguanylate cyclase (GGDEF)-like protein